jgi:hypothetical protein
VVLIVGSFSSVHKNAHSVDSKKTIDWVSAPRKTNNISIIYDKTLLVDYQISVLFSKVPDKDNHLKVIWSNNNQPLDNIIAIKNGGLFSVDNINSYVFADFAEQLDKSKRIQYRPVLLYKDISKRGVIGKLLNYDNLTESSWGMPAPQQIHSSIAWDKNFTARRGIVIDTNPVVIIPPIPPPSNLIQQVYFIMHSLAIVVLPARTQIDVTGLSVSIDIDAFAWLLNMQVADGIELIRPDINGNKEVEINVDGYVWEFIIESYTENKEFGDNSWTVTGRSKTAYLTTPYKLPVSTTYTSALNAAQIIDTELVGSGFTASYDTVDWLVSANAFSYQNLTSMQAIKRVADAVGGVILPHQTSNSIIINPRYQSSPWDWLTAIPEAILTSDVIIKMSGNWRPRPDITGVYVSGNTTGVECFVKRTGTAGADLGAQFIDNLITHQDAGREKGRNIISNRGKQEVITIELPMLPVGQTPAVYKCGDLLEIDEGALGVWRGIVLGTSISASANGGAITATQTLSIEKHYGNI